MMEPDIRWQQRLHNYKKALTQLTEVIDLQQQRELSNIEKQGFVKAFEFTHELAWKVMKDYFVYQGNTAIMGSRDACREAFQQGVVVDGEGWMDMIKTRNKAVHTYDEATVDEVLQRTTTCYYPLFLSFARVMERLADAE